MAKMTPADIIEKLRPNAYIDKHPIWISVANGLNKMSREELDNLWIVITCLKLGR